MNHKIIKYIFEKNIEYLAISKCNNQTVLEYVLSLLENKDSIEKLTKQELIEINQYRDSLIKIDKYLEKLLFNIEEFYQLYLDICRTKCAKKRKNSSLRIIM